MARAGTNAPVMSSWLESADDTSWPRALVVVAWRALVTGPLPPVSKPLATALLLVASIAATLAVFEGAARWAMRGDPGALFVAASVEPDPVRGWRHRPGARGAYGHGTWAINGRGLRDVERELAPPDGVARALILGDSFAEGFSVPFEACVSQALERELRKDGCAAEVVNGGTVGYSTDQEYLFYRDEGARYGARVVVLLLYYNDILYNARGAVPGGVAKPLFTFAGGVPRVKNHPLPPPPPATGRPRYWRNSAALTWFRQRLAAGAPRTYDFLARLRFWSPLDRTTPPELQVFERAPAEPVVQAWLQTEHLLRLLDAEVRRNGARLLVAYVPSKMEVERREWDRVRQRYGLDERDWDRGRVARLLEDAGRRAGFPVLDLTEALWHEAATTNRAVYHRGGGHWNEAGHAAAAGAIRRHVLDAGWLPCDRAPAVPIPAGTRDNR
jgi:hypothetical protein